MSDLSTAEQQELFEREARIESALLAIERHWLIIAQEMRAIRQRKLYRATHERFEDYCHDRWGKSVRRVQDLIKREDIWRDIESLSWEEDATRTSVRVFTPPPHDKHLGPLPRLNREERQEVWKFAHDTAPGGGMTEHHHRRATLSRPDQAGAPGEDRPCRSGSRRSPPGVGRRMTRAGAWIS